MYIAFTIAFFIGLLPEDMKWYERLFMAIAWPVTLGILISDIIGKDKP